MAYFYSHLINIEPVLTKLDALQLSNEQKIHLGIIVDSTIHNTVFDFIFSNLKASDNEVFVQMIGDQSENEALWEYLNLRIDNAEKQIYDTIDQLVNEFRQDIETLSLEN